MQTKATAMTAITAASSSILIYLISYWKNRLYQQQQQQQQHDHQHNDQPGGEILNETVSRSTSIQLQIALKHLTNLISQFLTSISTHIVKVTNECEDDNNNNNYNNNNKNSIRLFLYSRVRMIQNDFFQIYYRFRLLVSSISKSPKILSNILSNNNNVDYDLRSLNQIGSADECNKCRSTKTKDDDCVLVRRIQENRHFIDTVLQYWFVQYGPPDSAQKKLWMISSQSDTYRQQIDYDIVTKFSHLLIELSSKTYTTTNRWNEWCGTTSNDTNIDNDSIFTNNPILYGYQGKLAAIIVLDQFSRHIHRWIKQNDTMTVQEPDKSLFYNKLVSKLPQQSVLDQLAYQASQLLIRDHANEIQAGTVIPIPQFIFGIMPYRHASTIHSVQFVRSQIEDIMAIVQIQQHDDMMKRFRKATNRRLAVLQDEQRRTGGCIGCTEDVNILSAVQPPATTTPTTTTSSYSSSVTADIQECDNTNNNDDVSSSEYLAVNPIVTTAVNKFSDDDILECFPFETDMVPSQNHIVHLTIRQFLENRGILAKSTTHSASNNNNNGVHLENFKKSSTQKEQTTPKRKNGRNQRQQQISNSETTIDTRTSNGNGMNNYSTVNEPTNSKVSVIVSLSGGVDSMVIARVLAHLRSHCGYEQLHIVAAHIDYANRPESSAEAAYVQKFCSYHSIEYHCRRIDEVTRGITSRDDYEKISRDIRYQFYRDIIQQCRTTNSTNTYQDVVGVMLGHHRGDLRENVLSNSHKGCGPLDLSGMTSVSKNDGVTLYRPLLQLEKTVIFAYAHTYGIPYFKDTTPHWSTRGKLRNKLLPLLEEIYGEGSMKNLSNLAVESDECKDLLDTILIGPFMKQIQYKRLGISFNTQEWRDKCLYFWKVVLRDTLHSAKLGMFTDKSVESYVQRIQQVSGGTDVKAGWLQCRRDYSVYLRHDGRTYVLYPSTFPWHKDDYYDCSTAGSVTIPLYENLATTASCKEAMTSKVSVGPWHISVQNLGPIKDDIEKKKLLNRKAYIDMDDFMNGSFEYYLEAPSWYKTISNDDELTTTTAPCSGTKYSIFECKPLVFTKFNKATRPSSWKNLDTKIQDTLPLLGNTIEALDALKDPYGCRTVHTLLQVGDQSDDLTNEQLNPVYLIKVALTLQ